MASLSYCNENIYCIDDFELAVKKLRKNNSYKDVDELLISSLKNKNIDDFKNKGTNLNRSQTHPYVKLDVGGRSGFRLYYLAIVHEGSVYLGFIHPKTGSKGSSNTVNDARSELMSKLLSAIKSGNLSKVDVSGLKLSFVKKVP